MSTGLGKSWASRPKPVAVADQRQETEGTMNSTSTGLCRVDVDN